MLTTVNITLTPRFKNQLRLYNFLHGLFYAIQRGQARWVENAL